MRDNGGGKGGNLINKRAILPNSSSASEKISEPLKQSLRKARTKKKQIGYDCSCCDFAKELPNKDLENDFIYCCNPDCEFYYQVLFEHFRCERKRGNK